MINRNSDAVSNDRVRLLPEWLWLVHFIRKPPKFLLILLIGVTSY
jgi:hypothetical protein